ncbi:MAG TPA: hypothetical protein GXX37_09590 [Clostridiaceae bacterium]|nr:hypothetical protein [Clostridiaceae bacterium]
MSDFNYKLKLIEAPTEGSPGSRISLKVNVEEATEEVSRVYISVPEYGIYEVLRKETDTLFSLNYYIPYDAPYGKYDVSIWAVSKSNKRGPATNIIFTVK